MLGASARSIEPYFYIRNLDGKVVRDWININLTQIVNVTFANKATKNLPPQFSKSLENVKLEIGKT